MDIVEEHLKLQRQIKHADARELWWTRVFKIENPKAVAKGNDPRCHEDQYVLWLKKHNLLNLRHGLTDEARKTLDTALPSAIVSDIRRVNGSKKK